jgi:hypothetical protein
MGINWQKKTNQQSSARNRGEKADTLNATAATQINSRCQKKGDSRSAYPKTAQPLNWINSLGVVGALAGALTTYLQCSDVRHNFQVEQRSWARIGFALPDQVPMPGQPAFVLSQIANAGKSPITDLWAQGTYEVVDADSPPSFSMHQPNNNLSRMSIFPGDSVSFSVFLLQHDPIAPRSLTALESDKLLSGRAYIVVFGIIIYSDEFGQHWTRFCAWKGYLNGVQVHSQPCTAWNRTGEGKPILDE